MEYTQNEINELEDFSKGEKIKKKLDKLAKKFSNEYNIVIFVGNTGSGKTSTAQYYANAFRSRNVPVWSNVPLYGTKVLEFGDLLKYEFTDGTNEGLFIIDEAGIEFNNRQWEKLSMDIVKFMKLHRHFRIDVYIFSQGEDVDIVFRRLAHKWYKLEKCPMTFGRYSMAKPVYTDITIKDGKWQLVYELENFFLLYTYIPIYKTWGYFNSFEVPHLPKKEFESWNMDITPPLTFKEKLKIKVSSFTNFINKSIFRAFLRKRNIKKIQDNLNYIEDFKDTTIM